MTDLLRNCLNCKHWHRISDEIVGSCQKEPDRPQVNRWRGQLETCDIGQWEFGEMRAVASGGSTGRITLVDKNCRPLMQNINKYHHQPYWAGGRYL